MPELERADESLITVKMRLLLDTYPNQDPKEGIWMLSPRILGLDDTIFSEETIAERLVDHLRRNKAEIENGRQTPFVPFGNYNSFYRVVEESPEQHAQDISYTLRFVDLEDKPDDTQREKQRDERLYRFLNCRDFEVVKVRVHHTPAGNEVVDDSGKPLSKEGITKTLDVLNIMERKLMARPL